MSVDTKIIESVRSSVEGARQPEALSERLLAWFEALAIGNERLEDPDAVERHLELLFQATELRDPTQYEEPAE